MPFILKIYNWGNIIARKIVSFFYTGKRRLPLLHCNSKKIFEKNFPDQSAFSFIQVGAFDGISHDWLFDFVKKRNSTGLVIEPLYEYFKKLKENYSFNRKIIPVNLAIHPDLTEVVLYRVDINYLNQLPDWAEGISSIDPTHHQKINIPSEMITSIKVPASPLMMVVDKYYKEARTNLIQIDTEGFDYKILQSIDFNKVSPDIIKMEYINLSLEDITKSISLLRYHNYYCLYDVSDIIAIQLTRVRL